ncbi:hypothetical protein CDO52_12415 [Nocardiopsis gilva YIM 90087]|uniref:Serine dehydrogenasease n=1 Tax=Nocardiopsis gilva YIM 90087 TaxID=1235441 RepID=A0A223S5T4_9ACTN|nr:hypothetical protein [Nocardiopsis gilva]ASU83482.1 hypothetical protein CDO52_12415 [Nocardiopsis gilva YIM 90087]
MSIPPQVVEALSTLERSRNGPVIAYVVHEFSDTDIYFLYECLRSMKGARELNMVLYTNGGEIDVTRRIALLLYEFCDELNIMVPDNSVSSGTLLCLAAHKLTLGPMARLGPIDPHISASGASANMPKKISTEEIRAFREMASTWFSICPTESENETFRALSQWFFPATLGAFYRADMNVRSIAAELLAHQRLDWTEDERQRVIDHLVTGYHSHSHAITRRDAQQLGLNIHFPTREEENAMWECTHIIREHYTNPRDAEEQVLGTIVSGHGYHAERVYGSTSLAATEGSIPKIYWRSATPDGTR